MTPTLDDHVLVPDVEFSAAFHCCDHDIELWPTSILDRNAAEQLGFDPAHFDAEMALRRGFWPNVLFDSGDELIFVDRFLLTRLTHATRGDALNRVELERDGLALAIERDRCDRLLARLRVTVRTNGAETALRIELNSFRIVNRCVTIPRSAVAELAESIESDTPWAHRALASLRELASLDPEARDADAIDEIDEIRARLQRAAVADVPSESPDDGSFGFAFYDS